MLPHRGVENARIGGVHRKLGGAGAFVHEEHALPGRASVGGLEDTAFGVGGVERALRGHEQHVRVGGVHDDARDVARGLEAHFRPRLAGVGGAIDPVTGVRHHAAWRVFAGADVHDVAITRRDRDGADGGRREETVGDVAPGDAHVVGLPQAAAGGAHVVRLRVADDAGAGHGAAAAERADGAPRDGGEQAIGIGDDGALRVECGRQQGEEEQSAEHRGRAGRVRAATTSSRRVQTCGAASGASNRWRGTPGGGGTAGHRRTRRREGREGRENGNGNRVGEDEPKKGKTNSRSATAPRAGWAPCRPVPG